MPVPENTGSGESPGLFSSMRSFWAVFVSILHTRLDLATAELEEAGIRLVKFIAASLVSVLCLHTAFFFLMFFLLALVWDTAARLWVLGGIFVLYLAGGLILLAVARQMILGRPRFLAHTLAELKRDVEGCARFPSIKKMEANHDSSS